jgi:hypothetical protein
MAKKSNRDELFEMLRARGLRKRTARMLSDAASAGRSSAGKGQQVATAAITDLRKVADDLEARITGKGTTSAQRSAAAKKGAQTRKRQAGQRSQAAKKAARTRASKSKS